MRKHLRNITALVLLLCLAVMLPMTARADAWIPPDNNYNEDLMYFMLYGGNCYGFNAFLSNYAEANVRFFDADSSDEEAMQHLLKHIELNAKLFGSQVSQFTGEDGKPYMRVAESLLQTRMQALFGRTVDFTTHPGYQDGTVVVSAEHYDGPIEDFATANHIDYLGDGVYIVYFQVFKVTGTLDNWYGTYYYELPDDQVKELGTGTATFYYVGSDENTNYRSTDFALISFSMDARGIGCTTPNVPYGAAEPTIPETEAPTETTAPAMETTEPTAAVTEAETEPIVTEAPETQSPTAAPEPTQPSRPSGNAPDMVIVVLLVIACTLLAFVLILLIFRRKQ